MGVLTADFGTTSLKVSIFDKGLTCLSRYHREYTLTTTPEGYIEFSPESYWALLCHCVRECLLRLPAPEPIEGIVLTTQGETLIPVDEEGRPLRDAIVWLDSRGEKESALVRASMDMGQFYRHTGIADCNGTCPLCKILWLRENQPEIYEKTRYFLLLEDYLLFRLTGQFVSEKALMSTTGYYDIYNDTLWSDFLDRWGLDSHRFPRVLECGTPVGNLTREAAEALALPGAVTVYTGAMDQVCAAVGAGVTVPGILSENTGTATVLGTVADRSALESEPYITIYRHAWPDTYLLMPICMTGGIFLKWFKDQFCAEERQQGGNVYALLDALAASSEPGSRGLLALPYLNGSIQPQLLPNNSGVFYGMGLGHTRGDFVRCILESVGYMLRENIGLIEEKTGVPVTEVYSCGGGSRSALWNQIKADILNRPLHLSREAELTSLGAAMLIYGPPENPTFTGKSLPNPETRACYEEGYQAYTALLHRAYPTP